MQHISMKIYTHSIQYIKRVLCVISCFHKNIFVSLLLQKHNIQKKNHYKTLVTVARKIRKKVYLC